MTERLLTPTEAAELLGLFYEDGRPRRRWIMDQVRANQIPHVRLSPRFVGFEREVLKAWWQQRRGGPMYPPDDPPAEH